MGTELNLNEIFVLELDGILSAWGEVSGNLVDRDATWEGNTSLELL
jgi:hypothetical protein